MKSILCYGDSNTFGYNPADGMRYPINVRWTGVLQELLGNDYRVIEEGCNGRTTIYDDTLEPWKNGLSYLRPCLNTHKPLDIVILMLGSNDLKDCFHLSAEEIAQGAGTLVDVINEFTKEKQGFIPKVILMAPPEIGEKLETSPFYGNFSMDSIARSKEFPKYYSAVAKEKGCIFLNAAEFIKASDEDSLHLTAEAHRVLAEKLCDIIKSLNYYMA